ncbi:helix-turn-helix domain-containing protein [Cupriavidus sp. 30B13]|uniref:helix-turn-helix transcriptional regulator n=1 Tax=Cupriavidus sp. 30B13 TaxID=3384241 RepID=UPI003B8F5FEE
MPAPAHFSPKLHLTAAHGFALHDSRQADFRREWHTHDCGMLLWPRMGRLKSAWEPRADEAPAVSTRLVRGDAVLLPAGTTHLTVAEAGRQQHGELYLAPEHLRAFRVFGAVHLDGATIAMLEALLSPMLAPASSALLVRAIVAQLVSSRPLAVPAEPASLALRMVRRFTAALERDGALPSIEMAAAALGVSVRQLQRACQIEFGASPVAIRRRVLAAHARALLAEGRPLARVSEQLGFASSGHLTRLLRASDGG